MALSASEDLLSGLFQHRYDGKEELGGHNLGNLILAALAETTGSFLKAVEVSSAVLRTVGRILPVTLENVRLQATVQGGALLVGETAIGSCTDRIERVSLSPATAQPTPGVVEAILEADLVVFGPGSLYTSVVPNLVLTAVSAALCRTSAVRVLVGNLVSGNCEAAGLGLEDHLKVIEEHAGGKVVDALLAHEGPINEEIQRRYEQEGATPLAPPSRPIPGVHIVRRNLLSAGAKLRHDSDATAAGLHQAWRAVSDGRDEVGAADPQPGSTGRDRCENQNCGEPEPPNEISRAAS